MKFCTRFKESWNKVHIRNQQLKTHKVSALKLWFLLFYPIVHPKMQVASHHPELFSRWSFFVRPVGFVVWRAILFLPRSWRVSERSSRFNYPSLRLAKASWPLIATVGLWKFWKAFLRGCNKVNVWGYSFMRAGQCRFTEFRGPILYLRCDWRSIMM